MLVCFLKRLATLDETIKYIKIITSQHNGLIYYKTHYKHVIEETHGLTKNLTKKKGQMILS